jgi:hypothetical protein
MTQRLRGWLVGAVLIVVGVLVGYALPQSTASPKSEIGTVTKVNGVVGSTGSSLVFKVKGQQGTISYPMQDQVPWQDKSGGTWHSTSEPSCLVPGAKVTLGVISVHAVGSAPGGPMVVWVECYG